MLQNLLAKAMGVDKKVNQALYEFLVSESGIANVPIRSVKVLVSLESEKSDSSNGIKFSVFTDGAFVRNADILEIVESQQEGSLVGDKIYEFLKSEQKRLKLKQEELNAVISANSNMQIRLSEMICGIYYDDFTIEDVINGSRPSNYQEPQQIHREQPAQAQEQKSHQAQSEGILKKPNPENNRPLNQALYEFLYFEAGKIDAPITDVGIIVSLTLVDHPQIPDACIAFPRFSVMHGQEFIREAEITEIVEHRDAPVIGSKVSNFFVNESQRMDVDAEKIFGLITAGEKENEVNYAEFVNGDFYDTFAEEDVINEKRPSKYKKPE